MKPLKSDLIIALALCLITLAVFRPLPRYSFIGLDDDVYVTENTAVQKGLSSDGLHYSFSATVMTGWHPLTWLSHMADVTFYGMAPGGHHLTSLVLHMAATALLYLALVMMTGKRWPSAMAAALFALHPAHVESVAWIAERKDVLAGFFFMLGLTAYARYLGKPGVIRYSAVLLSLLLGLLCKPMLVTFPLVLLVMDYWPLGRFGAVPAKASSFLPRLVIEKVPLLVLSFIFSVIAYQVQNLQGDVNPFERGIQAANALVSYSRYLLMAGWPHSLAVFYPHPADVQGGVPLMAVLVSLTALSAFSVFCLVFASKRPYLAVGWLWYLGMLTPVIGLVQIGGQAMADRYTYLPFIGLFLMAAWVAVDTAAWMPRLWPALAGLGLTALLALAAAAGIQVGHWRDSISLFRHGIAVTEKNWLLHNNLAIEYQAAGRLKEAEAHYRAAIESRPGYADAQLNLGAVMRQMGRPDEALEMFYLAGGDPRHTADAGYRIGFILLDQSKWGEAADVFSRVLKFQPAFDAALAPLGYALLKQGKHAEASAVLAQALRRNPGDVEAQSYLEIIRRAEEGR